jgi:NAD(P)-dependent dehydrogenase (short-subunit alcohol dehydrogenase family)
MSPAADSPGDARTVVITGVGRGLGPELAQRFHERGAAVWGTVRAGRHGLGDAAVADGRLAGLVELDLADERSVVDAAARLASMLTHVDVLVNCAGLDARAFGSEPDRRGPFDVPADAFTELVRINATGPMIVTRELLPLLRAATAPMIVNVSSQLGSMQVAATKGRDSAYCVSKAALNMWSVKAAADLREDGIGVVMIHPGWVQTDMGGASAQLTAFESSTAMAATIDALSLDDSGRFIRWDGTDHPW